MQAASDASSMTSGSAFISEMGGAGMGGAGIGLRVAVKDLIDVVGSVTTAGCRELERRSAPAIADAECLAGIRAAESEGRARIVGKTHMHELAFGVTGINPALGTPVNPLDPERVPGGSSSGSAAAVASGLADIALGSDTGGSVRIPAACCGVVGLKTTWGRVSTKGCWPLSPFLDTIGPMAASVADVIAGMDLLEPGFAATAARATKPSVVGRLRPPVDCDPAIDAAVDATLRESGLTVLEVEFPLWNELQEACLTVLLFEAWQADGHLVAAPASLVSEGIRQRLAAGSAVTLRAAAGARGARDLGLAALRALFAGVQAIALPTLPVLPPTLADGPSAPLGALTRPGNLMGIPALSLPIPVPRPARASATAHLPASLQLLGLPGDDEVLVRIGAILESAAAS